MATFKIMKVVGNLPPVLEPDTIYLVRTGVGYDEYVSDSTGSVAHPQNQSGGTGGSSFLPEPDEVDDTDETYFYWGWASVNGSWFVRRTLRSNSFKTNATISNNSGYFNLVSAWSNRTTLMYS